MNRTPAEWEEVIKAAAEKFTDYCCEQSIEDEPISFEEWLEGINLTSLAYLE